MKKGPRRGRGMMKGKRRAFQAKMRAGRDGAGPCAGLRGWRKWRCRMRPPAPLPSVAVVEVEEPPPEPDTGLLGWGFWGL